MGNNSNLIVYGFNDTSVIGATCSFEIFAENTGDTTWTTDRFNCRMHCISEEGNYTLDYPIVSGEGLATSVNPGETSIHHLVYERPAAGEMQVRMVKETVGVDWGQWFGLQVDYNLPRLDIDRGPTGPTGPTGILTSFYASSEDESSNNTDEYMEKVSLELSSGEYLVQWCACVAHSIAGGDLQLRFWDGSIVYNDNRVNCVGTYANGDWQSRSCFVRLLIEDTKTFSISWKRQTSGTAYIRCSRIHAIKVG